MAEITKVALKVDNNSSFPNNNAGAITPSILRAFNTNMIDSLVDEIGYTADSSSWNQQIDSLEQFTASLSTAFVSTGSFNTYTASIVTKFSDLQTTTASMQNSISALNAYTASDNSAITNLNAFTASQETKNTTLATYTASVDTKFTAVAASTSSLNTFTGSQNTKNTTLATYTASVDTKFTAVGVSTSSLNTFTGSQNTKNTTLATYTASVDTKFATLGTQSGSWVTETESGSFLITASVSLNTITFTKGNNTTFAITVNTGSGGGGSTDISALNAFTSSQLTINSAIGASTSSLNTFSSSVLTQLTTLANVTSSLIAKTGSYATTGSNTFVGNQTITGNITAFSASFTYLQTIFESSSVIYSSGSNQFGDELTDIQTLSGSVKVQGSLTVNGTPVQTSSVDISALNSFTASQDTKNSTLANVTASLNASTASQQSQINSLIAATGSFATTGSNIFIGDETITGSFKVNFVGNTGNPTIEVTSTQLAMFAPSAASPLVITHLNGNIQITSRDNNGYGDLQLAAALLQQSGSIYQNQNTLQTTKINGSLTASLQEGYAWIGGAGNISTLVATSSFAGTPTDITSLNTATASLFTSASLGLTTASFTGNTLTFTKGNGTTFGVVIPDVSGSTINTGSFATTGSNTFYGNQIISGNVLPLVDGQGDLGSDTFKWNTVVVNGQLKGSSLNTTGRGTVGTLRLSDETFPLSFLGDREIVGDGSGANTHLYYGTSSADVTALREFVYAQSGSDANFTSVSASFNTRILAVTGSTINTGSFATTGSNTFTGDQTLTDASGNTVTLTDGSGSLILVAKSYTSASAHLSSSANQVNLIFKNSDVTADTIISGSNNIFTNPNAPTAGFKRYIGGSNNIINTAATPLISGSMQFSPTMAQNYIVGGITLRGPVSASTYTISSNNVLGTISIGSSAANNAEKLVSGFTMTGNSIGGTLALIANQSALSSSVSFTNNIIAGTTTLNLSSSAVAMGNNIINDSAFTFTNQYYTGSLGLGSVAVNRNNIGGQNHSIIISGSLPVGGAQSNSISDNFIFGGTNTIYIDVQNARLTGSAVYKNVIRTGLMGNNLIVSGSSLLADASSYGSVFVGRFNADDNRRNKTSDTVFAVGTGNTTTRKTGFLIDSGSNSYFEGTLNVSGSTSFTGSVAMSSFTTLASVSSSLNFADDTAAAAGGVPLGGLYRNGNFVMIRLT